ncbi:pitrilysin family protein [Cupriavidus sp. SW-Y-13]|uniref:M16 family metallopeptidase n=1 Tax=Cupriavidus sp. SW-Y-13 TaxID=2653854 RepID=UPI0013653947|nr:pitrilysin family protein [Cupriavidus sp. SW-Y-13]MWL90712.1 insulinase family protein [Cupriavidus sp. SW-Y-13]
MVRRCSVVRIVTIAGLACALLAAPVSAAKIAGKPASTAAAAAPVARATPVTTVEGITEYRLPNGLRILLAPDDAQPTTTVNMTYLVGSRHENYGETGMAHLLEHLLFKGTPSLPGRTIPTEFARRGMQYNGTTNQDRTNYFQTFAASDDNLDWALRMEADRMVNSFVARADLDSEMSVVRNEMEIGENNPMRMLQQQMYAAAYRWHNYGKAVIGARSDVERVGIENLQAFYRRYYQPDNAVLVVTGQFDPARTLARIEQAFGPIPRPTRVLPPEYTVEPPQEGLREVTLTRSGDSRIVATMYHVAPGAHADSTALDLLSVILADTPGGRLERALVDTRKAAWQGSYFTTMKDPGVIGFAAGTSKDRPIEPVRDALVATVESLATQPVTQEELERARVRLRNAFEKTLNDPAAYGIALSGAIAKGDWRLFFIARDRVESTTLADVQRVAENYFRPANRTVGEFIPGDRPQLASIPASPDVAALTQGYAGKPAAAAVAAFDPAPANIDAHTLRETLPNGMQLALLPKPTRGGAVHGTLILRIGSLETLQGKVSTGAMTAAMLDRGAGGFARQQIADRFEALKANVSVSGSAERVTVRFETRREYLPDLMALLRTVLRMPTFPGNELETLRASSIAGIESQRSQPGSLAPIVLGRHGNPYRLGDPRYTPTFDESLAELRAVTLDDLRDFHAKYYGAEHAQLAIVGDFDAADASRQAALLFGDWRAQVPFERVDRPFIDIPASQFTLQTAGKANAVFAASQPIDLVSDSPDYPLMLIASRVLGGTGMRSRLADRLRQRDGISYGVSSSINIGALDRAGRFGLWAMYAPQNLPRLRKAVDEEMARFVREGITAEELSEASNGLLEQGKISRTRDGALAGALANQAYLGRTMAHTAEIEMRIRTATPRAVNDAIRRYLGSATLSQAFAGDFGAAPGNAAGASAAPAASGGGAPATEAGAPGNP